jgi:type IV pilus assembly protein PilY1
VTVFGNGYNNTDTAGETPADCTDNDPSTPCTVSTSGDAVLYVIDIAGGTILEKLDTGVGRADDPTTDVDADKRANGLAQVTVVDADGDLVADFAYAGDLFGNLWKFDLTDLSAQPKRIFIAKDPSGNVQPITTAVAAARHPTGVGTVVLFGTGKLLGQSDVTDTQTQTFYGIWDYGQLTDAGPNRGDLQQQTFLGSATVRNANNVAVSEARVTSANTVDWSTQKGWYIDLCPTDASGDCATQPPEQPRERVTVAPQIQADRLVFVSLIPQSDPCSSGGTSWINALSINDGSRLATPPFDLTGDGTLGSADLVTVQVGEQNVTAAATSIRLLAAPGVYSAPTMPAVQGDVAAAVVSTSEGQLATLRQSSALEWTVWRESR